MDFLDNSGHIFSLPSYQEEPVGYEFEENKYIFWIDPINTNTLSINNYYAKVINFVVYYDNDDSIAFDDLVNIEITLSSNKFWFIKPDDIQNMINQKISINDFVHVSSDKLLSKLTNDDLIAVTLYDDINSFKTPRSNTAIIPIYIVSTSEDEGSWISNILIHVSNKNDEIDSVDEEYCPISVGGIYEEQNEILYINGQNMGIQLPKEIFKSIYQCSYINDVFDEQLYNEKLREYLLNFMDIKGELGNYNSIIKSLEWFGYGDKITLSKLLQTDNEFKAQYVKDFFNINNDILDSFKTFTNNALISLTIKENTIKENEETKTWELYEQDFSSFFWGENKPKIIDLFNSIVPVENGIGNDKWTYYKPYYDYSLYEMGLKLSCLKYYYQCYFLPIHLKIHSASITHQVFMNDIKFNNYVYMSSITEHPIEMTDTEEVKFKDNKVIYFTKQIHYVDDNLNEFNHYKDNPDTYRLKDICLNIPIEFKSFNKYYNCVLLLEKKIDKNNYTLVYESHFNFIQTSNEDKYNKFILYPKLINKSNIDYYIDQDYILRLLVNDRWYTYKFISKLQDIYLDFGTISYDYGNDNNSKFSQLSDITKNSIQFNSYLYEPEFVTINSIKYATNLEKYIINNSLDYVDDELLKHLTFNDHIEYNGHKIWFENSFFNKNHNIIINKEINNDIYIINENLIFNRLNDNNFERLSLNDTDIITITNNSYTIFINDEQAEVYKNEVYKVISKDSLYQPYIDKLDVSNNENFINKIYVYDLYKEYQENNEIKYKKIKYEGVDDRYNNPKININIGNIDLLCDYNNSQEVVDLYNEFFYKEDGKIIQNINIYDEYLHYDLYLMHDLNYWYIVFISKETLDKDKSMINEWDKEIIYIKGETKYKLVYSSQSKQFLINRMKYTSKEGINHFTKNDMICARLFNEKLPFNPYISSKWEIIPKSIGMNKKYELSSNAEFTILSLMNDNEHQVGYYDVHVRYCIDNNVQYQLIKSGKIRVSEK